MTMTSVKVQELFDCRDGQLIWRKRPNARVAAGTVAGTINNIGYSVVAVLGKKVHAHRLIWLWHGRELPEQIDHINGDRADNRIENLRASDYITNACNSKARPSNTSGVKNICWCNTYRKWVVQIIYGGGKKISGRFRDIEEAKRFATEKRAELHGEFATDGVR